MIGLISALVLALIVIIGIIALVNFGKKGKAIQTKKTIDLFL